jgi:hypothetical protein
MRIAIEVGGGHEGINKFTPSFTSKDFDNDLPFYPIIGSF